MGNCFSASCLACRRLICWRGFAFRAAAWLEGVTLLPLVLPPTVLGYALLVGLGRRGALGRWLEHLGHPLVFTWQGAVVAACVASLPLFVTQARVALAGIDPDIVGAARTDGAEFRPSPALHPAATGPSRP